VRVAPGVPVVVLAQAEDVRRAELEPWTGERVLALDDLPVLVARAPEGAPVELAFRVLDADGRPLAAEAEPRMLLRGDPVDQDPSPEGVRFTFQEGEPYNLRFAAEGHVSVYRSGRAHAAAEPVAEPIEVRLPPERP